MAVYSFANSVSILSQSFAEFFNNLQIFGIQLISLFGCWEQTLPEAQRTHAIVIEFLTRVTLLVTSLATRTYITNTVLVPILATRWHNLY